MGKIAKQLASITLCAALLVGLVTACGSSSSSKTEATTAETTTVAEETTSDANEPSSQDKAMAVTVVQKVIKDKNLGITVPDILKGDWLFVKKDGMINATVTGANADGSNNMITCWFDYSGNNFSVHYFDTKDGVVIDDGQVKD